MNTIGNATKSVIGLHTLSNYTKEVAKFLKLENHESYTSHCIRRSSASLLIEKDFTEAQVMNAGRWTGSKSCRRYQELSKKAKMDIADAFTIPNIAANNSTSVSSDNLIETNNTNHTTTNIYNIDLKYSKGISLNFSDLINKDHIILKRSFDEVESEFIGK